MNLEFLNRLSSQLLRHPRNQLRELDDASCVPFESNRVLIKVDGYALSRSLYPWCTPREWGFRAVTSAVSDVYAKGCRPYVYAISIGLPPFWREHELEEVIRGVTEAVHIYGGFVENLDTNYGSDGWIDVFVVAECRVTPIPRFSRSGAAIIITRRLGAGGYAYLYHRYGSEASIECSELCSNILSWGCRPSLNPRLPRALEEVRSFVLGSIDISDTFYEALEQISKPFNTEPFIYVHPRAMLINEYAELCQSIGLDLISCALMTCEDYALILAVEPNHIDTVIETLERYGESPLFIGWFVDKGLGSFRGYPLKEALWNHLSGSVRTAKICS